MITIKKYLAILKVGVFSPFLWSVLVNDVLHLKFSFPSIIIGFTNDLTVATYHKDTYSHTYFQTV